MRDFKILVFFLSLYASGNSFATLVATNSPVKSREAVFRYTAKKDFSPTAVEFAFYNETGKPFKTPLKWVPGTIQREQASFLLKVITSELTPGKYKAHVRLKGSSFNGNQKVENVQFEIDESLEINDPGDANNLTLEGIDKDNDGIRDDVQRYINESYNSSLYPSTNKALKKMYMHLQKALINKDDKVEAKIHYNRYREANGCLMWIVDTGHSSLIRREITSVFLNTSIRSKASFQINSYYNGEGLLPSMQNSLEDYKSLCQFDAKKEVP
jgi:hypothetical protein